jgi:hypothetical protein
MDGQSHRTEHRSCLAQSAEFADTSRYTVQKTSIDSFSLNGTFEDGAIRCVGPEKVPAAVFRPPKVDSSMLGSAYGCRLCGFTRAEVPCILAMQSD